MKKRACPLKFAGDFRTFRTETAFQCQKEYCEWWDKNAKMCAIRLIALAQEAMERIRI